MVTDTPCGAWLMMYFDEEYGYEYEGQCELPKGHTGDHFDGVSWFNDQRELTDNQHD